MFIKFDYLRDTYIIDKTTPKTYIGGYTNRNYRVCLNNQVFVLRCPTIASNQLINRHDEARILAYVAPLGLDVLTLYFNPSTGIKVTRFNDALRPLTIPDDFIKLKHALHLLHSHISDDLPVFNPVAQLQHYAQLAGAIPNQALVASIKALYLNEPLVLCHNDLTPGNVLIDSTVYLIDYEYAALNIELFDVVSFALEHFLSDALRQGWFRLYYGTINHALQKKIDLMIQYHALLWYYWADVMYKQTSCIDYLEFMAYRKSLMTKEMRDTL